MNRLMVTMLAASALALTGTPAFAQHRGGGGHGGGSGAHAGRAYSGRSSAAPRSGAAVRGGGSYSRARGYSGGSYARGGGAYYRSGGGRVYGGRVYGGGRYLSVAPTRFYRPYYAFRPRVYVGLGVWAGYPFAYADPFYYPYAYDYPYDPYAYSAPYPYSAPYAPAYPQTAPYAPPASAPNYAPAPSPGNNVTAQPDQASMGGLSFAITPADAQLLVDGQEIGTVGQFTSTSQPLGLPAGRHHVEVRAQGYRTMSFDVDIIAGQVIPYQGTLER